MAPKALRSTSNYDYRLDFRSFSGNEWPGSPSESALVAVQHMGGL